MSPSVVFEHAGPRSESDIRRLLRSVPLGGAWSIALAREPDGFGGPHLPGERQDFIIARDTATGEAIGVCERVLRPAYVAGVEVRLPYIGSLRIAPSHRHRLAILKGGFAALRECEASGDFPVALTSITSDNTPARRILTAGLHGLPTYRHLTDFSTFAVRPRRMARDCEITLATHADLAEVAAFLTEATHNRDCTPVWSETALAALEGISLLILRGKGGVITGCLGVWDQSASRQAVLAACPPAFQLLRGPASVIARLAGFPRIPARGEAIRQVFLSHAMVRGDDVAALVRLLRAGLALASASRKDVAVFGAPTGHRWSAAVRRAFRVIEYRTSLFAVSWPGEDEAAAQIDPARLYPEIALL